jgi:hypothetical protein
MPCCPAMQMRTRCSHGMLQSKVFARTVSCFVKLGQVAAKWTKENAVQAEQVGTPLDGADILIFRHRSECGHDPPDVVCVCAVARHQGGAFCIAYPRLYNLIVDSQTGSISHST